MFPWKNGSSGDMFLSLLSLFFSNVFVLLVLVVFTDIFVFSVVSDSHCSLNSASLSCCFFA